MARKIIIIGSSGTGKSCKALSMAVRNRGTTIIANGIYGTKNHIDYIERTFPDLKKFQKKDATRCFCVKEREKYYLCVGKSSEPNGVASFTNAIVFGCDYGTLCNDRKAMVVYDNGVWNYQKDTLLTLWKLSHVKCKVIITVDSWESLIGAKNWEISENMKKDIQKKWNVIFT